MGCPIHTLGSSTVTIIKECLCSFLIAVIVELPMGVVDRPGPLILPIIQELYSPISTPLFKRKLPIILKKVDKN